MMCGNAMLGAGKHRAGKTILILGYWKRLGEGIPSVIVVITPVQRRQLQKLL